MSWEESDRPAQTLFVETDAQFEGAFWADPNAFLVACVLPAWRFGERRVRIEAEICPILGENLRAVFRTLASWYPELGAPPSIEVKGFRAIPPLGTEAASLLSCGVDSLATLRRNKLDIPPDHPAAIRAVIPVDFCETPSRTVEEFRERGKGRMKAARSIADDVQVDVIPLLTNIKWLAGRGHFFSEQWHGAVFTSAASLLSRRFQRVYIASSFNASALRPWGSHPLLDPYYSSGHVQIMHDGIANSRFQKTKLIADWPAAVNNVRVCQNDDYAGSNCGTCEKCIWTSTAFVAFGKLQDCEAFPERDVTPELIHTIEEYDMLTGEYIARRYRDLLGPLRARGRDDLAVAIEHVVGSIRGEGGRASMVDTRLSPKGRLATVVIRKMRPSDLAGTMNLLATYNMAPQPDRPNAERSGIIVDNSFVAEDAPRIVGVASYIVLNGHLAETASLAVDPDYRGRGIGFLLQQARLDEMRDRGIRKVRTEADRPETIRWYVEKFGYTKVGVNPKKHRFSLPDVDHWAILELELVQAPPGRHDP